MVNIIDELRWKPKWVTHLGCIKGCLDYLDIDVSDEWLFGATGHAFIINIDNEVVCPSGPTSWNTEMLFKLGKNIGYTTEGEFAKKSDNNFAEIQKLAWKNSKRAINEGLPCYGWELEVPEYYVVNGFDDKGYYYSGCLCDMGTGVKPWNELGNSEIGVLEMYRIGPTEPENDKKTVKDALKFAIEYAKSPEQWIFPEYKAGVDGYDNWIKALENGKADGHGMAYNSIVWYECRYYAVKFLKEAEERIGGQLKSLFGEARKHYRVVANNLKKVADTFPFLTRKPEHIKDKERCRKAIELLKIARDSESSGLNTLEKIVETL